MFHLKGCPKCRGDLFFEKDFYGSYFKCLQCGLMIDVDLLVPGQNTGQNTETVERVAQLVA